MKPSAEALFERHYARVYQYFLRVTGRPEAAEDLAQDLFLRLVRAWHGYEALGHEAEWVFRAARNLALDYRRKTKGDVEAPWQEAEGALVDAPQVVAFGLTEALGLLGEADRQILLLHEIGGLTYQELASTAQTTATAVSQRLYRIRRRLRELLGSRSRPKDREHSDPEG